MAKGFIRGVLWGAGVGVSAVTFVSIADTRSNDQTIMERIAPASGQTSKNEEEQTARSLSLGPSVAGLTTQDVPAPEPDTLATLLSDTVSSAAVPQTGGASDLSEAPPLPFDNISGIADPAPNAPRVGISDTKTLQTPASEPTFSVSTQLMQPEMPRVAAGTAAGEQTGEGISKAEEQLIASVQPRATPNVDTLITPEIDNETSMVLAVPDQPVVISEVPVPDNSVPSVVLQNSDSETDFVPNDIVEQRAAAPAQELKQADVSMPAPQLPAPVIIDTVEPLAVLSIPTNAPASVRPEPARPKTPEVIVLPKTLPVTQKTVQGESASTRVVASLTIEPPQTQFKSDKIASVGNQIAPAPGKNIASPLPIVIPQDADVSAAARETAIAKTANMAVLPSAEDVRIAEVAKSPQPAIRVNQLPSLIESTAPRSDPAVVETLENELSDVRPVDKFSAPFEREQDKPLMAVLLVDQGSDLMAKTTGIAALSELPYPVSFAVDALLPDAPERMAAYRAAGFEVLASVDLPAGATAADAEVNLSVALAGMPEVVGVLDGIETGVQTTPDAGRQVAEILAQTGHGFVTQNRGLNTVQKLAARSGVPSGVVFRDFDSKGQTTTVIRRFLDQAAFRAGQEGAVIMLGRLREETVSALLLWTLQDRAATVVMSPVSAALRAQ